MYICIYLCIYVGTNNIYIHMCVNKRERGRGREAHTCISLYSVAAVHRIPDRSSPYCSSLQPPIAYPRPRLFRPRKLIKIQLIKITYFSSIGVGRRLGDRREGTPRVRPFDLFFFVFALLPLFPILPDSRAYFPFCFFVFFLQYRSERGELSCYLKAVASDIAATASRNMGEFGY